MENRILREGRLDELTTLIEAGNLDQLSGGELLELLCTPPLLEAFVRRDGVGEAVKRRLIGHIASDISERRGVRTGHVVVTGRLLAAWPDADWAPLLGAIRERVANGKAAARDGGGALPGLYLLFWSHLTRDDLVGLYRLGLDRTMRNAVARHPLAGLGLWRELLARTGSDAGFERDRILEHAAAYPELRSDRTMREAMLAGGVDVLIALARGSDTTQEYRQIVRSAVERFAPVIAYHVIDVVPMEERGALGDAVLPLLGHSSRNVRLDTQMLLSGGSVPSLRVRVRGKGSA